MTDVQTYSADVAHRIGHYSDAVRIPAGHDQIVVSGTPGLDGNGAVPESFEAEARQAWQNVARILQTADSSLDDIVSVRQYLTTAEDVATYSAVRAEFLTHEPASMLLVVNALVWPTMRVEIEVVAASRP